MLNFIILVGVTLEQTKMYGVHQKILYLLVAVKSVNGISLLKIQILSISLGHGVT